MGSARKGRATTASASPSSGPVLVWPSSTPRYRAHLDASQQLQLVMNLGDPSLYAARCRVRLTDEGVVGICLHVVQQREGLLPKERCIAHLRELCRVTMDLP